MGSCCSCCEDPPPPKPQPKQKKPTIGVVLSDVDNTLIHFEDRLLDQGYERVHAVEGENSDDEDDFNEQEERDQEREGESEEVRNKQENLQKALITRETSIDLPPARDKEENKPSAQPTTTTTTPTTAEHEDGEEGVTPQPKDETDEENKKAEEPRHRRREKIIHKWRHRVTDTVIETYSLPFSFEGHVPPEHLKRLASQKLDESLSASATTSTSNNNNNDNDQQKHHHHRQRCFISLKTLNMITELKKQYDVRFCLHTNYDFVTFISRCKSRAFPDFDYAYCEGGAKLITKGLDGVLTSSSTNNDFLDLEWFQQLSPIFAKKTDEEEQKSVVPALFKELRDHPLEPRPEYRKGLLWDCYRRLVNKKPGSKTNLGENVGVSVSSVFESAFSVDMFVVKKDENKNNVSDMSMMSPTKSENNNVDDDDDNEDEDGNEKLEFFEGEIKIRQFIQDEYPALSVSVFNKGRSAIITAKGCSKLDAFEHLLLTRPELLRTSLSSSSSSVPTYILFYIRSIENETTIADKELKEKEAILAKKQQELQDLMFTLEDSRQRKMQLESDIKYWRKVISEDNEMIEMEVDELDRLKVQHLQNYKSSQHQLLSNIQQFEQLVNLAKKKLDGEDDESSQNNNNDNDNNELPEQLQDIIEGVRLLLTSKDEQLADDAKHNVRMSRRTWGTGQLAFMCALTSDEFVDEIQNFSPENVPGFMQEKIFRITDETPSFTNSISSDSPFSSAQLFVKWVMSCVAYFPKEESEVYPARRKIKKKQKENKQRQNKIDANLKEIEEIEERTKDGIRRFYWPLKKEVKQLELLVEHLRMNIQHLTEKKEKLIAQYKIDNICKNAGNSSTSTMSPQEQENSNNTNNQNNPLSSEAAVAASSSSNENEAENDPKSAGTTTTITTTEIQNQNTSDSSSKSASSSNQQQQVSKPTLQPQRILSAAMFDDQDDLEFVKLCDIGFAPVISHPLVRMFIENRQKQQAGADDDDKKYSFFEACPQEGLLGTEYALQKDD